MPEPPLASSSSSSSTSPTTATATKPQTQNPRGIPPPPPSYSHLCTTTLHPTTKLITLAGQTGCDPSRTDNPTTVSAQAAIAYGKIKVCLEAVGAGLRDVVMVRHYVVVGGEAHLSTGTGSAGRGAGEVSGSGGEGGEMGGGAGGEDTGEGVDIVDAGWAEVWERFMDDETGGYRPPDTVVGVAALAKRDILYECEVMAVVTN